MTDLLIYPVGFLRCSADYDLVDGLRGDAKIIYSDARDFYTHKGYYYRSQKTSEPGKLIQ